MNIHFFISFCLQYSEEDACYNWEGASNEEFPPKWYSYHKKVLQWRQPTTVTSRIWNKRQPKQRLYRRPMVEHGRALATQNQTQENSMRKIELLTLRTCWMIAVPWVSIYKMSPVWRWVWNEYERLRMRSKDSWDSSERNFNKRTSRSRECFTAAWILRHRIP